MCPDQKIMIENKLDVYKVYKKFDQRWRRNQYDDDLYEMKSIARNIAQKTFIEEIHKTRSESNRLATLSLAMQLESLERKRYCNKYFSLELVSAIKNNLYCSNVPHEKSHRWLAINNFEGVIYLFIAKSKPGQVKLGATYGDPHLRVTQYSSKFQYKVELLTFSEVINPWKAEMELANILRAKRVSGYTEGDSNEWFYLNNNDAKAIFDEFISNYSVTE